MNSLSIYPDSVLNVSRYGAISKPVSFKNLVAPCWTPRTFDSSTLWLYSLAQEDTVPDIDDESSSEESESEPFFFKPSKSLKASASPVKPVAFAWL